MPSILEASAREVYEAYHEALLRKDWISARFWRPIVIERLGLLSGRANDSERPADTYRANPEG